MIHDVILNPDSNRAKDLDINIRIQYRNIQKQYCLFVCDEFQNDLLNLKQLLELTVRPILPSGLSSRLLLRRVLWVKIPRETTLCVIDKLLFFVFVSCMFVVILNTECK